MHAYYTEIWCITDCICFISQLTAAKNQHEAAEAAAAAATRSLEATQAALSQAQAQQRLSAEEAAAAAARASSLSIELGQLKAQQVGEAMELVETLVNALPDDEQVPGRGRAAAGALDSMFREQQQQQEQLGLRRQQKQEGKGKVQEAGVGGELGDMHQPEPVGESSKQRKRLSGARRSSAVQDSRSGTGAVAAGSGTGSQG